MENFGTINKDMKMLLFFHFLEKSIFFPFLFYTHVGTKKVFVLFLSFFFLFFFNLYGLFVRFGSFECLNF